MKATVMTAAALLGGASAHNHGHAHDAFRLKNRQDSADVVCKEVVQTITGTDFIWVPTPSAQPLNPPNTTTTETSTAYSTAHLTQAVTVPTPAAQTCATPGTYTFPATTLTVTETTSGVVPSSTVCTPGAHTIGGVTTIVETATTVVCPYATVKTASGGVVTSVIESTTYVCPSAGTYTIAPTTTTVTAVETVTVPSISTILPGTYTAPAVTTVVETSTVVYCPFASVSPTSSSTPSAAPVASASSSATAVPVVPSVASSSTTAVPVIPSVASSAAPSSAAASSVASSVASSAVSSVASSAPSSSSTSSVTGLGGNGNLWSLTYTPYNPSTGDCQSAEAVEADVAAIAAAGFKSLRTYSTDCDTLTNVGAAAEKHGLKLIVGVFIGSAGCTNASPDVEEQISAFKEWARWDLVELFSVANEAINNNYCTASELAALISHVKSELPGYSGPWTTTDVVSAWQKSDVQSQICGVIDVVTANVHAYFTSSVAPSDAGPFVKGQLEIVEKACGLDGYVLETGFPTEGATIGLNVPSVANQAIAIKSILDTIGDKVVLFSMFDDKWKAAGSYGCEQSWGIAPDLFGSLGSAWQALVAAL